MATGVVEAIYKLSYFILLSMKKKQGKSKEHREKTGKTQGILS